MELKRLLTRANALLLQGAYQGAESFIEQAMVEADKLKKDLAELDTLRTRVTEMAAEVERLQSAIDEANAQEPVIRVRDGRVVDFNPNYDGDVSNGEFFARPIPAQQSPAVEAPDVPSDEMVGVGVETMNRGFALFGENHEQIVNNIWDDMYAAAQEDEQENSRPSPRITEQEIVAPKPGKCCSYWRNDAIENSAEIADRHSQSYVAQDIRNMKSIQVHDRVTEQDARDIAFLALDYRTEMSKSQCNIAAESISKSEAMRNLLDELNGDHNGK